MNKKTLKKGAGLFAVICIIMLIIYVSHDDQGSYLFDYHIAFGFFLLLFGAFWGALLYLAIDAGTGTSNTGSAGSSSGADDDCDTPFKTMMRSLKGSDTKKEEDSQN